MSFDPKGSHGFQTIPKGVADFVLVDFTTDGTWKVNGLDFNGLIPKGAYAVMILLTLEDNAPNSGLQIRQNSTNAMNIVCSKTNTANIICTKKEIIAIDSDLLLDYKGDNLAFTSIELTVLGYYYRS